MNERQAHKLKMLIKRQDTDNRGDLLHSYLKKQTDEFSDITELTAIMEVVFKTSLFVGCRELLRLKALDNASELKTALSKMENGILKERLLVCLESEDVGMLCEAILAYYVLGIEEDCGSYLKVIPAPARYIYNLVEMCLGDEQLVMHVYDLVLFILNAIKDMDDFANTKCIRAIRFQKYEAESFLEKKQEEICKLAKWYYEHEQYSSLSSLMRIFEIHSEGELKYKAFVYEFVGVSKEEFLQKAYENRTARALDFYFLVKYGKDIPALEEVKHILELNTPASIYCVVVRCLKNIRKTNTIQENVRKVLSFIKEEMRQGKLSFDYEDERLDGGIENAVLKTNIEKRFQDLCSYEQDVKEFLELLEPFNAFANDDLRLDYNIVKDKVVKNADWESEYAYVCEKYANNPIDVMYVVMNSYLRFFVDVEELYANYKSELKKWWFPGYITNKGNITLFQSRYNPNYAEKEYSVVELGNDDFKGKVGPEELKHVRFKIKDVSICEDKMSIEIDNLQSIAEEFKKVMEDKVVTLLQDGKIVKAYHYLKGFQGTGYNLFELNRFAKIRTAKFRPTGATMLEELFINCSKEDKPYLQYIYLNSAIKTYLTFDYVKSVFSETQYLLGDVMLNDNPNYKKVDYYNVRPNYYPYTPYYRTSPNEVYCIKKENMSKELVYFIDDQLKTIKEKEKEDDKKAWKSVRVCFALNQDSNELSSMYLHCCEQKIGDLKASIQTYYTKVSKTNRQGIASSVIVKFLTAYKECNKDNGIELNEEWKSFLHLYLFYLKKELGNLYSDYPKNIKYWMYGGNKYQRNNIFMTVQTLLLNDLKIHENEAVKEFVKKDINYQGILEAIHSCDEYNFTYTKANLSDEEKDIVKIVYDTTIMKFLFDTKEELLEAICYVGY